MRACAKLVVTYILDHGLKTVGCFTNGFFLRLRKIEGNYLWSKENFIQWSLQNIVHCTQTLLHEQNYWVIWSLDIEIQPNAFLVEFDLWTTNCQWTISWSESTIPPHMKGWFPGHLLDKKWLYYAKIPKPSGILNDWNDYCGYWCLTRRLVFCNVILFTWSHFILINKCHAFWVKVEKFIIAHIWPRSPLGTLNLRFYLSKLKLTCLLDPLAWS